MPGLILERRLKKDFRIVLSALGGFGCVFGPVCASLNVGAYMRSAETFADTALIARHLRQRSNTPVPVDEGWPANIDYKSCRFARVIHSPGLPPKHLYSVRSTLLRGGDVLFYLVPHTSYFIFQQIQALMYVFSDSKHLLVLNISRCCPT